MAGHLFVAAEGKVDVLFWHKALPDEAFRRLHHAQQRDFCIQRAAAPQLAVEHFAAERRVRPALLFHRHHIIVRHQHRGFGAARALPAEQKARGAPLAPAQHGRACLVHRRVKLSELFAEFFKLGLVHLRLVIVRHSGDAHKLRQALHSALAVHLYILARAVMLPRRPAGRSPRRQHHGKHRQRRQNKP